MTAPWHELTTEQKVEHLKKILNQWDGLLTLLAPRLGELRELMLAQSKEIDRLMCRIEEMERAAQPSMRAPTTGGSIAA